MMRAMLHPPRTAMELFKIIPEGTLCELIDDAIIVRPVPWMAHNYACKNIFIALYDKIKNEDLGETCYGPVDVYLNEKNAFQPDIIFISKKRKQIIHRKGLIGAPDLVIEILSDNTAVYDRTTKKDVYEQTGVKEYWMIDPISKICEGFIARQGKFEPIKLTKGSFHVQLVDLPFKF